MTVQSPPYAEQNASHSAALFRQSFAASWQEGGPLQPSELWVAAQSTPNMSVQVGAGRCVIQGTQVSAPGLLPSGTGLFTSQAMYFALNDAAVTVTISAADPTNPRIDVVYIAVQDAFYSGSNNQALVGVVTGTPAPSPVAPAAPANAEVLATVAVAANATSVTNGNITNKVSPASATGAPTLVQTLALLNTWSPLTAGTYADVYADSTASNNGLYRWTGSAWVPMFRTLGAVPGSILFGTTPPANAHIIELAGTFSATTNGSGDASFTYPAAFPNGVISVVLQRLNFTIGDTTIVLNTSQSLSVLNFRVFQTSGAVLASTGMSFSYIALGW